MAKTKEYVTLTKDGLTITVDKKLTKEYISSGWKVVDDKQFITNKTFNKFTY